jgi:hypothetical protein
MNSRSDLRLGAHEVQGPTEAFQGGQTQNKCNLPDILGPSVSEVN